MKTTLIKSDYDVSEGLPDAPKCFLMGGGLSLPKLKGHTTDFFYYTPGKLLSSRIRNRIFFLILTTFRPPPLTLRKSVFSDQKRVINDHDR